MNVSFNPDGTTIASVTGYTHVHLWDVATGELRAILGKDPGRDGSWGARNASFSPDGRTLTTYRYNIKHLWDAVTGKLLKTVENPPELINPGNPHVYTTFITFSPDGNTIVTSYYNKDSGKKELHLWDVVTGKLRNTIKIPDYFIENITFSPDGNTLAYTRYNTVFLSDITTGKLRGTLEGNSLNPTSLISPDGNTLAIGNLLWDISTGTLRDTLKEAGYIQSMSFSPDGSILATGSGTPWYLSGSSFSPNWVHLWDVSTGTLRNILKGHTAPVMGVSFSPDGSTIATGSVYLRPVLPTPHATSNPNSNPQQQRMGELLLWDVTTGQQKNNFPKHVGNIYSISFNFDGSSLAVGSGNNVYLLDAVTGEISKIFPHVGNVYSLSFSPDGNTLATGSDGKVRLWDVTTATIRTTFDIIFKGYTPNIRSVKFSPDGKTLAASIYNTVYLWDVATRAISATLKGHGPRHDIYSISFSPDGSTLASGSRDGTVLLWKIGVPKQLKEDINGDGVVNIQDLVLVAAQFGQTSENRADVNGDDVVNIQDLVLVAAAFSNASAAPTIRRDANEHLTPEVVQQWLVDAKKLARTDVTAQRGIAVLEFLLAALTPKETALLPNYPNPFNPETWIPYQLAKRADVSISIYSADGKLVRMLNLGQQAAGVYESQNRAAYWNGKNEVGEFVASGVYFYTLKAGDFTATRKMLIRK
ncbi:MAG: T9SS type A sorting domain-containing protein [Candidatus Poribacteria bacterium]|nr:T9SS type A sorting domain-containing protein [Candidatus Poribacteria bacterium]